MTRRDPVEDAEVSAPIKEVSSEVTDVAEYEVADVAEHGIANVTDVAEHDVESEEQFLRGALEAILMIASEPVPVAPLARALNTGEARVEQLLRAMAQDYASSSRAPRGFQLREVGGGWRFYSHPHYAQIVGEFVTSGQTQRLSVQALETLAVIAYRQPVSRAQIAAIRGVEVDSVVRTLMTRGLIEHAGNTADTGAGLYQTTPYFLARMGLNSLQELPDLAPYLPDNEVLADLEKEIL